MQALLKDLASIDDLATMTNRPEQRPDRVGFGPAPGALTNQPDQSGAIPIVGLEPPRPQLAAGCRRLRRREQSQRPRPAPLEL
jgi:hypothetical protein